MLVLVTVLVLCSASLSSSSPSSSSSSGPVTQADIQHRPIAQDAPLRNRVDTHVKEGVQNIINLFNKLESYLAGQHLTESLRPKADPKIVGGRVSQYGDYPFAVSLKIKTLEGRYLHFCGGAAITTYVVLTAAHCVASVREGTLFVSIGDYYVNNIDKFEQVVMVSKIILHPGFVASTFKNDIAVLQLIHPFLPHAYRQTIGMMEEVNMIERDPDLELTVLGWGSLKQGGESASSLNHVLVPYIEHDVCKAAMSPYSVFDGMLCAGDLEKGGIDACQGDSGGPMIYKKSSISTPIRRPKEVSRNAETEQVSIALPRLFIRQTIDYTLQLANSLLSTAVPMGQEAVKLSVDYTHQFDNEIVEHRWELGGIVSWGIGCAKPGYAGIYTNVAFYKDWINQHI